MGSEVDISPSSFAAGCVGEFALMSHTHTPLRSVCFHKHSTHEFPNAAFVIIKQYAVRV